MSILDRNYIDPDRLTEILEVAGPHFDTAIKETGLDKDPFMSAMMSGISPKQILDISDKSMGTLFAYGIQCVEAGSLDKARDIFSRLHMWDPMEPPYIYSLALTHQLQGVYDVAAQLYLNFLTLDATSAVGYLRLGECLFAAGEHREAKECLLISIAESKRGNGSSAELTQAEDLLKKIPEPASNN